MLKKDYSNVIILFLFLFLLFILCYPTFVISEVETALITFITKYFPAVFPIYIITDLFIYYHFPEKVARVCDKLFQKVFHCNGMGAFVLFLSMVSGFPSGAKYTKELLKQGIIEEDTANYVLTFTHFSNPLFILGTCYLITQNKPLTYGILFCHFLANFIIAFIIRPKMRKLSKKIRKRKESLPFREAMSNSIFQTFHLMFLILGTNIIFSILSCLATTVLKGNPYNYLITGLLELTKGVNFLPKNLSVAGKGMSILLFLSFGSLSIHMQVASMIKDTNMKYRNFLLGRLSQTSISILLFYLLLHIYIHDILFYLTGCSHFLLSQFLSLYQ